MVEIADYGKRNLTAVATASVFDQHWFDPKESRSFLKKRTKNSYPWARALPYRTRRIAKVFWFFFTKRNRFLTPPLSETTTHHSAPQSPR
jgi:hypothetical protein